MKREDVWKVRQNFLPVSAVKGPLTPGQPYYLNIIFNFPCAVTFPLVFPIISIPCTLGKSKKNLVRKQQGQGCGLSEKSVRIPAVFFRIFEKLGLNLLLGHKPEVRATPHYLEILNLFQKVFSPLGLFPSFFLVPVFDVLET